APDQQQRARGADEYERDEQDETDTAAAAARPAAINRRAGIVVGQVLLRHDRRGIGLIRVALSAPAGESPQGARTLAPRVPTPASASRVRPHVFPGASPSMRAQKACAQKAWKAAADTRRNEDARRRCAGGPCQRADFGDG